MLQRGAQKGGYRQECGCSLPKAPSESLLSHSCRMEASPKSHQQRTLALLCTAVRAELHTCGME
uniref:Uncharacterized protein n=1 Tax=Mus spicilegus TaxID=10103 RepID=A0A8C6MYY6_MUSSI